MAHDDKPLLELIDLLEKLEADTPPKWGGFTAQHMVEHLFGSFAIGNGRFESPVFGDDKRQAETQALWLSEEPFPMGIVNPFVQKGPLRQPTLEAAIGKLRGEVERYYEYWADKPAEHTRPHPWGGAMTRAHWDGFERKHTVHHLKQFGLLEEDAE